MLELNGHCVAGSPITGDSIRILSTVGVRPGLTNVCMCEKGIAGSCLNSSSLFARQFLKRKFAHQLGISEGKK